MYSSKLLDALARGEPVHISSPDEKGDWLYVKDAVKALLLVLERKTIPQVGYNIMGGVYSIREAMMVARNVCPEAVIAFADGAAASDNPYPRSFDDSCARRDLGWSPDYSLEAGFREHISIMRGGG